MSAKQRTIAGIAILVAAAAFFGCKAKPLQQQTDFLADSGGEETSEQRDLYPFHQAWFQPAPQSMRTERTQDDGHARVETARDQSQLLRNHHSLSILASPSACVISVSRSMRWAFSRSASPLARSSGCLGTKQLQQSS